MSNQTIDNALGGYEEKMEQRMAINLREAAVEKMAEAIADTEYAITEEGRSSLQWHTHADAALTTIEPTLRRALEALDKASHIARIHNWPENNKLITISIDELKQLLGGE